MNFLEITIQKQKAINLLVNKFAEQISCNPGILESHGRDESTHIPMPPDAVFFAQSTEDIATAVKICAEYNLPIIPYGAGTSLEGHLTAVHGGLSIDMSRMNRVIAVNENDMDVRIEAGITRKDLNAHLRDKGLFFPVDPGANCTLGGMVATRASGTNAVKYGTIREQLLSLKVITASGDIIETGTRSKKSAAGYDLTHLFCGSEGTLGIVTEISLKVHGIPEKVAAGICRFTSLEKAVNTVISTIQMGIPVSRIELLDTLSVRAVNGYSKTEYPEANTLFIEFSGSEASVQDQIENFTMLASEYGGTHVEFAENQEDINALWHARHQLLYATRALSPGKNFITTDVCIPISSLAECIIKTRADLDASGLFGSIVGHVGDGNFHTIILYDPAKPAELEIAESLNRRMVRRAIDMGGTSTGEHGIGTGKREFLVWERESAIPVMRMIKQALDPKNIMNPGKIFLDIA
ncbi:FAD-binding oxidoreductase [Kordiimonas pumila]|uniref:D-lactate dehydrogenase (cytochrome) n=1 Tax=Kordiimonas pumila TaxID=2161677 RepID=A0ABV7D5M3_9PROT